MAKNYSAQVNRIAADSELDAVLKFLCETSNNLYNCTTYLARQLYFKAGKFSNGRWLSSEMRLNPHFQALFAGAAQQTCIAVGEAFKGYGELLKLWRRGELPYRPKPPNYRKSGGLYQVSYSRQRIALKDGMVRLSLGKSVKTWFGLSEIFIPFPSNLDWGKIKELQIVPRAMGFDAVWIHQSDAVQQVQAIPGKFLSIDHGVNNWLTCVTPDASFIVDGYHLKSLNQGYNRQVSIIKTGKPQAFWCNLLDRLTAKRNRQMRDAVNKAARVVINHCLENGIGVVVFGWNKGQKQNVKMGKKTNQKFVQIPTAKLKNRIAQLCEAHGIEFIEQEESYTSKASTLDLDFIPVFGAKPEGWEPSGKRLKRGLYRSADGTTINADCNGAWNIARKAKVTGTYCEPARGVLTSPRRLRIWDLHPQPIRSAENY
jgi:IS605 OrfB family transposase